MMKVCRNCHTENPLDAALCSECGMSLRRALTGEAARIHKELRGGKRTQPEQPPTASGIVYLFGEQFAEPWGVGSALPHALLELARRGAKAHSASERLLYSGQKVFLHDLVARLFEVAFVSLAQEGYISLSVQKIKILLFPRDEVTITQERDGDDLPPSLERAIMDTLRGDLKECRVKEVVKRVLGAGYFEWYFQRWLVLWKRALNCVTEGLAEAGYLEREVEKRSFLPDNVHWSAKEEAIAPLAGEADTLKSTLEAFASANPYLHKTLVGEVRAGIEPGRLLPS